MSPLSPDLSVIIPAYNEARRITPTLQRINNYLERRALSSEILVVLDGPTDNTLGVLRQITKEIPNLKILNRTDRRGKGYTVREGMLRAAGRLRLFCDADNSTDIAHFDTSAGLDGLVISLCSFWPSLEFGIPSAGSRLFALK